MSALIENRSSPELEGKNVLGSFTILATEIMYAGGMGAQLYTGEVQEAADVVGLRVLGRVAQKVDNTLDGLSCLIEAGVFQYDNSSSNPLSRLNLGQVCYVETDQCVASTSTYLIAAGLVFDVDANGVWVDQRPAAMAEARRLAQTLVVANTATTYAILATHCFQGNVCVTHDAASIITATLPTAVPGYRIGAQRISATAAHDNTITANTSDTIRGGSAGGNISNTVDAISGILWLYASNAANWIDDTPLAADRGSWA